jgi:biotin transport system substrate-specific component
MTTLPYAILQDRRIALLGTLGFALALAAASQVAIPLPGTPVPVTLQPFIVVLAGMMLGPALGTAAMLAYLAAGAVGLPVFSPFGAPGLARFVGPTGGYLIAFPAAAFTAGYLAQKFPALLGRWMAATLGIAVLFVGGIAQLTLLTGSFGAALAQGITPFALLDIGKALVAALIARPGVRTSRG